jgi:Tfp pilus assembly protein PilZ
MHERRKAQRFPIEQPVRLTFTRAGHYELQAVTKDVSTKGVFVYVESEIVAGSEVELLLNLPAENGSVPVRIRGRAIRVEKTSVHNKHGVGIAFEKVEILPE